MFGRGHGNHPAPDVHIIHQPLHWRKALEERNKDETITERLLLCATITRPPTKQDRVSSATKVTTVSAPRNSLDRQSGLPVDLNHVSGRVQWVMLLVFHLGGLKYPPSRLHSPGTSFSAFLMLNESLFAMTSPLST
jgi:hypothetical protein